MNKKLLAGLAVAGLLAGGGGTAALAGVPSAAASTVAVAPSPSCGPHHGPLESLVTKGTITQSQATAIRDGLISNLRSHWRNTLDTVLGQLVKQGTITKAQASQVTTALTKQLIQAHPGHGTGP